MLVLACLLIQTHDVTKSPLSCFVTLRDSTAARRRPAALENAHTFPQLRSLPGSSPRTAPGKRKGPVAGTLGNLVGAEGLEPSILAARDFKSPAYANSATPPCVS